MVSAFKRYTPEARGQPVTKEFSSPCLFFVPGKHTAAPFPLAAQDRFKTCSSC